MALGKVWLYSLTGSVGILASLVHSALDMVAAASSFISVRFAVRAPNQNYRFGFGKAESFSAVFQVCLIGLVAFHLLGIAAEALFVTEPPNFSPLGRDHSSHTYGHLHAIDGSLTAIIVMSLFVVLTFWLLIAQSWAIRSTGSIAIRGDRAHYLADLLGNLFVMIGLALATFTAAHWADAVVGMLMAIWLLFTGYRVARLAWAQLMDQELNPDERKLIINRVMADKRILAVTNLRTRASGPHLHMQMRLDLDPHLSLSESHDIVVEAEARLMAAFPAADILIHPHPAGCAQAHGNIRFNTG
jgi:cation diffusion facilitator family transporter